MTTISVSSNSELTSAIRSADAGDTISALGRDLQPFGERETSRG